MSAISARMEHAKFCFYFPYFFKIKFDMFDVGLKWDAELRNATQRAKRARFKLRNLRNGAVSGFLMSL
jgi:hypothetical protein